MIFFVTVSISMHVLVRSKDLESSVVNRNM